MDFLCKDLKNNTYHAGQSKCYTNNKITSRDICTFQSIIVTRLKTKGFLYTTTDLEINLREDLLNAPDNIVHHKLVLETNNVICENVNLRDETVLELYNYQQEALAALIDARNSEIYDHNRLTIKLFCGGGKTLILGHYLKQCQFKLIVCIAPLIESVDNLLKRLMPFLTGYEHLLVDSDTGGTTNPLEISNFITKNNNRKIIFSTFDSAENILAELTELKDPEDDWCFISDEVHNMVNLNELCEFTNSFNNAVLLSATIPEEIYDVIDCQECYSYSIDRAIANGYSCDYRVYLPYMNNDNRPEYLIPKELAEFQDDLSAKAMFLATGMLMKGSRRCIAYMSTQDECDAFLKVLKQTFQDYHAVGFWGDVITSRIRPIDRKKILHNFEKEFKTNTVEIRVIVSVRILDDAIDIPVCDSVFISRIGDNTSDIRTMQRVMRAGRIVRNNPNKINNVFMWCDEWSEALYTLSLFKQQDIEFHKKMGCIHGDYDRQHEHIERTNVKIQSGKLSDYVNMQCLSNDEIWNSRLAHCVSHYEKLGKFPSQTSNDTHERRSGSWISYQRYNYKHDKLSSDRIEKLVALNWWVWEVEKYTGDENLDNAVEQYNLLKRIPSGKSKEFHQKRAGLWLRSQRTAYRNGKLSQGFMTYRFEKLIALDWWSWETEKYTWDEQLTNCVKQYEKLGKIPSSTSTDADERRARCWMLYQRVAYKKESLSIDRIEKIASLDWWDEKYTWDEQLTNCVKQYEKLGKIQSLTSIDADDRRARSWIRYQRIAYKKDLLSVDRIEKITALDWWIWDEHNTWDKHFTNCVKQYEKLGKIPSTISTDTVIKRAGQWVHYQRTSYKKNILSSERRGKLVALNWWVWGK